MVNGTSAVLEPTVRWDALISFAACLAVVLDHVPSRPNVKPFNIMNKVREGLIDMETHKMDASGYVIDDLDLFGADSSPMETPQSLPLEPSHDEASHSPGPRRQPPLFVPSETPQPLTMHELIDEVRGIYNGSVTVEKKIYTEDEWLRPNPSLRPSRLELQLAPFMPRFLKDILKDMEDSAESLTGRLRLRRRVQKQTSNHRILLPNENSTRVFEIPCQIAEKSANALGDYGAKGNFLREGFATQLGLPITRSGTGKVTIGSGKQVETVGSTVVPFRFREEKTVHVLKFHLLPDCIHDVIVGKQFLKITETFSNLANYARRVKERMVKGMSRFSFLYLGASTSMVSGSINGQPQTALADSGSKVLVMDEAYARKIGVKIETGHHLRRQVIFADNSVAETMGMAYDVEWRFGYDDSFSSPYQLDFHILRDAPVDVILSDTFLFDNEVFSRYQECFTNDDEDYEDEEMETYFFAIDFDERQERLSARPHSYSLADLQHLEVVRRGEEADRISTLSGTERITAQAIEDNRLAEWNREFKNLQDHAQSQRRQQHDAIIDSNTLPSSLMHPIAYLQVSKSSCKTKRYFPTLATWLKRRSQKASTN